MTLTLYAKLGVAKWGLIEVPFIQGTLRAMTATSTHSHALCRERDSSSDPFPSLIVLLPFIASRATRALNAASCRFRFCFIYWWFVVLCLNTPPTAIL